MKTPKCACGTCRSCRLSAKIAARKGKPNWNDERMPWPAEYHTLRLASCYGQYFGESAKITKPSHYASQE